VAKAPERGAVASAPRRHRQVDGFVRRLRRCQTDSQRVAGAFDQLAAKLHLQQVARTWLGDKTDIQRIVEVIDGVGSIPDDLTSIVDARCDSAVVGAARWRRAVERDKITVGVDEPVGAGAVAVVVSADDLTTIIDAVSKRA
jgi:hypothetical protein